MSMEIVRQYADLIARKRDLEAKLRQVKEELGETEGSGPGTLERLALAFFAENGMQSTNINGLTLYVNRQLWAHAVDGDYPAACAALQEAGLGDFVQPRFNIHTLSSWVRERDKEGEPLPAAFEGKIEVSEVFRLGARRS